MKVLVTGAAGFIGMHVSQILLARGDQVVGLDNLNDYYSPQLKHDRLARLTGKPGFSFVKMDVADREGMAKLFAEERFDRVVHLAAQAGVRYSIENPHALHRQQHRRLHQHPGRLPPQRRAAPGLCVQLQRVRRQHADAVLRASQRRPSHQPVRRHQEGQRADGAHLLAPVRPADDGLALLHGLRPLGPAGHGAVPLHQGDHRRPAHQRVQPRQDDPRLHLRGRHRRGRRARAGPHGDSRRCLRPRQGRPGALQRRLTGCSTSATTLPSN